MTNNFDTENFFGYSNILEVLEKRVSNFKEGYKQNIALIGKELSGKSLIIKQFLKEFKDEEILHIYLELKSGEFCYFARKFFGGLLYNFVKSKDLPVKDDLAYLIAVSQPLIPKTVQQIVKIESGLQKDKPTEAYRDMISLPEIFIKETGKFCLVIIDEFQRLDEMKISNPFQELGKKIISQKNSMFILTSSTESRAREIFSEDLSLLFGNFEIINVDSFDIKTGQAFIDYVLEPVIINQEYKNFIINFTGGNPFYLKLFCQELKRLIKDEFVEGETLPMLVKCIQSLLFEEWGLLNSRFQNRIEGLINGKNSLIYLNILLAVAGGHRKIKEIMSCLHKNKKDISLKINRLMELNLISKNVNSYYLPDKIFNFWLRYVYQKKLTAVSQDPQDLELSFRKKTQELIGNFVQISEKDTSDRIVELFNLFTAETLQLDGHRYRFSSFREVKPIVFSDKDNNLLKGAMARSKDSLWFILLKEDRFVEEDVLLFLAECRKHRYYPQRRIIISLGETETNAKLRALKEKMWVWDIADLNTVLNLYDRPFIVK